VKIIISLLFPLLICGCGIEEKIDTVVDQCEDKILKLLETVDVMCLTKEEILMLIRTTKDFNTPDHTGERSQ
jgi:hypothetical protein